MDTTTRSVAPIVFKVGGSLLNGGEPLPPALLRRITSESQSQRVIVLFGGGQRVDRIRHEHRLGKLTDEQAHWQAIDMMDQHAQQFAPLLPKHAEWVDLKQIDQKAHPVIAIQVGAALRDDSTLPVGWHITSDSIAGWVARKVHARRLILAKSVGKTGPFDPIEAHRQGWVDDYFPTIARDLLVTGCVLEWFNAREASDTTE